MQTGGILAVAHINPQADLPIQFVNGTRHSVRLDQLIDLVSERIRYYVQTYYELDSSDLQPQKDTRREALEQKQKSLTAQLEKGHFC